MGGAQGAYRMAQARRGLVMVLVGLVVLLAGCATTRNAQFGPLSTGEPLVILVVTGDLEVVTRECAPIRSERQILGCEITRLVTLPNQTVVRALKVVRYTDALPSAMAFEIDAHELCHVVVSFQAIADPCHNGNGGVLQTGMPLVEKAVRR